MNPLRPLLLAGLALALAGCAPKTETAAAPAAPASPGAASAADLAAGKAVYQRICMACHMADGNGVPATFPPLNGSELLAEADPGKVIRIVLHGLQGPLEVKGKPFNSMMPPQGALLKDHEIAQVLTYVRATYGNGAPPVTADAVAAIRQNVPRPTPWTWAELNQK